jgi:uncharacterized membrane protein YfcA
VDFAIVGVVAFLASGLTLYSGFGLGTILLPAFALFFPAPTAVAATAIVHLLNNLFKGALVGRFADWPTVWRFGLPAIPGAILGALVLNRLDQAEAFRWTAFGREFTPSAAGIVIGSLMILFALLEMHPRFQRVSAPPRLAPLGGFVTGLFGGMSGQQGALRSMFLLKSKLDAQRYIATGILIAILIDLARIPVYAATFVGEALAVSTRAGGLIAVGTICAFAGAWLGARYVNKATIGVVRLFVVLFMLLIGVALALGILGAS